jgi:hypothetical protein
MTTEIVKINTREKDKFQAIFETNDMNYNHIIYKI